MAKKSSKHPPKRPIMANQADTSLLVDTDSATTPPDVTLSPTHIAFRDFIKLADIDTINTFLTATTSTSESENLKLLWERAYREGFENGQKAIQPILHRVGVKMKEKLEKGVARGMDLGREEGYMVAKEAFDSMLVEIKAKNTPKVSTSNSSTQTNPLDAVLRVTTDHFTQTNPIDTHTSSTTFLATSQPRNFVEKGISTPFSDAPKTQPSVAFSAAPADATVVLYPETPPTITNFTQKHPDTPVFSPKEPLSSRFNWADDARTLPILSTFTQRPSLPPRDLSGLRSPSTNPFWSLKRRRRHPQNSHRKYFQPRFNPSPRFPTQLPRQLSQRPYAVSLDWDQDPRLADLSKALRALGWVQR